ncbi:hypothetical protein ABZ883_28180 [Streptomyces sp. NPDC046977]|uniref:hypothetical protein n=1 Tax=Streptomyces sp. NPDC046977 TaxID=3154703 RepID=UPI003404EB64
MLTVASLAAVLGIVLLSSSDGNANAGRTGRHTEGVDLLQQVADYTSRFGPDDGYRPPTKEDRTGIAGAVGLLLDGRRTDAEKQLSQFDFTVTTVRDRVSGHHYAVVADRTESAVTPRGWGRVYLDLDSRPRWSVQVPHPVADRGTEELGVRVLRGAPGGVLVVAGAHRASGQGDAADVAHRRDTVFHAVCAELARHKLPAIQVHGFARSSAPGYDVIASTAGAPLGRPEARRLADALADRDFHVCRAWSRHCPLEGTENMQGQAADEEHVPFLHVEFAPALRGDGPEAERAAAAVTVVTRGWAGGGTSG